MERNTIRPQTGIAATIASPENAEAKMEHPHEGSGVALKLKTNINCTESRDRMHMRHVRDTEVLIMDTYRNAVILYEKEEDSASTGCLC